MRYDVGNANNGFEHRLKAKGERMPEVWAAGGIRTTYGDLKIRGGPVHTAEYVKRL